MLKAFKGLFKDNDDDDDLLADEEELYSDDYLDEDKPKAKKRNFFSRHSKNEDENLDEYFKQEEEEPIKQERTRSTSSYVRSSYASPKTSTSTSSFGTGTSSYSRPRSANVVPMHGSKTEHMEVVVKRPASMDDANEITDTLLSGRAVILNLEGIHVDVAQRIIDYSAGSVYAMRGNFQRITNYIFVVTPDSVELSGDFQTVMNSIGASEGNVSGLDSSVADDEFKF